MLQSRPIGDEDLKRSRPCQRLFIETGQLVQQFGRRKTSGRVKMTTPFPPISASSPNEEKKKQRPLTLSQVAGIDKNPIHSIFCLDGFLTV
jgi:hypothetical protein